MQAISSSNKQQQQRPEPPAMSLKSMVPNTVMLSYCRRNSDEMHVIHDRFASRGFDCWVDFEDIAKSVDWWEAIKSGIEGANACVVFLSNEFLISKARHCYATLTDTPRFYHGL